VTALLLVSATGDAVAWIIALPLLAAGVRGGMVTSPNTTLTMEHVPTAMAVGGALQTAAHRLGDRHRRAHHDLLSLTRARRSGPGYSAAVREILLLAVADPATLRRRPRCAAEGCRRVDAAAANEARPTAPRVCAGAQPSKLARRS
jgi:hypothetical protein